MLLGTPSDLGVGLELLRRDVGNEHPRVHFHLSLLACGSTSVAYVSEIFKPPAPLARTVDGMNILFITSFAVIAPDPPKSRELYVEALGLPLTAGEDGEYFHSEEIAGSKHFGVWPLSQAAEACFGTPSWPAELTVPQASV